MRCCSCHHAATSGSQSVELLHSGYLGSHTLSNILLDHILTRAGGNLFHAASTERISKATSSAAIMRNVYYPLRAAVL